MMEDTHIPASIFLTDLQTKEVSDEPTYESA